MTLAVFARCLGLTLLIELCFALLWGLRQRYHLLTVALVQVTTNPLVVWLTLYCHEHLFLPQAYYIVPIECAVVVVEGLIYRFALKTLQRPFVFSLGANYVSFSLGCVLACFGIHL